MPTNKEKRRKGALHALSFSSQIGFTMAACIFVGVFSGKFLDKLLGTSPWFLLVFSLLGAAAAFWMIFRLSKKNNP